MMKPINFKSASLMVILLFMLACSLPGLGSGGGVRSTLEAATNVVSVPTESTQPTEAAATAVPSAVVEPPTPTVEVSHSLIPLTTIDTDRVVVNDVVSVDTAAEKRAPYGDSYKSNLFERPFMQDMTYIPDLDIVNYSLGYDEKFFYVSIQLVGSDPNNEVGIDYAVELDMNADGFGDYIIVAHPPYDVNWSTNTVQIVQDTNRDTGGLSPERSDAQLPGDGYDTVIFDGGQAGQEDPDLAWVRVNAGKNATVQFAFKRSFGGAQFMFGVLADAGIRNVADLDYVDRYTEEQAGSPEKSEKDYPLKAVYAVDNICREAYGFIGTGDEPQRCVLKK